ncbi:heavy metal translocating P-type ATPase [Stratiformator vulcanicus]|uniref:Zinc/cadmium/mercury/lead-transporting ATPase n=1 Tax=Stratiformator vulcanicus TaxID=2527980 RepID=A0A517QVI8_9PLAN|nr:heavy metal-associated domain-containing protein [Stratiformator vulcanicus]QDT35656.1 zinc/cadmium/mercury/lead-transporting ATPase [Stratiformator vulcanicus]
MSTATVSQTFRVEGMHCESCVRRIEASVGEALERGQTASITLAPPEVTIEGDEPIDKDRISQAVQNAGDYRVQSEVEPDTTKQPEFDTEPDPSSTETEKSYYPLILMVGILLTGTLLIRWRTEWSTGEFMADFMGGFLMAFAFFKLLDLRGFAATFSMYDLVAKAWKPYAYVYPFIELGLGAAYLGRIFPTATNIVTIVVMLIGSIGVLNSLLNRRQIRCACMGTVINLPMSTVTLIEDVGMAAMAAGMLLMH